MGILRSIESRLERVVEGSVGRLFRASVAPVELARKLAKELEEGKVVSVTQTYAPNEYTIYLSPRDRTRFADFEASLRNELASYLAEHARRAGYVMPTRPRVRFETESSLHTGIFGISTALVRDDDAPHRAARGSARERAAAEPRRPSRRREFPPAAAEPELPVRSPLDPDPRRPGRPASRCTRSIRPRKRRPSRLPELAPEPEPEPGARAGAAPAEPAPSPSSFSPHLPDAPPLVPGVPLHEALPTPPRAARPARAAAGPARDGAAPGCAGDPARPGARPPIPTSRRARPSAAAAAARRRAGARRSCRAATTCRPTRRSRRP